MARRICIDAYAHAHTYVNIVVYIVYSPLRVPYPDRVPLRVLSEYLFECPKPIEYP